jgi:hypothetical protein
LHGIVTFKRKLYEDALQEFATLFP